jgi:hypothetical protein
MACLFGIVHMGRQISYRAVEAVMVHKAKVEAVKGEHPKTNTFRNGKDIADSLRNMEKIDMSKHMPKRKTSQKTTLITENFRIARISPGLY